MHAGEPACIGVGEEGRCLDRVRRIGCGGQQQAHLRGSLPPGFALHAEGGEDLGQRAAEEETVEEGSATDRSADLRAPAGHAE